MADTRSRRGNKQPAQESGEADARLGQRFIETARALGCDEDEGTFKAKLAIIARPRPQSEPAVAPDEQHANEKECARVTKLPARKAKGALSTADWAVSRVGMRDKAQRVGENKRRATKSVTKPIAPGTKR